MQGRKVLQLNRLFSLKCMQTFREPIMHVWYLEFMATKLTTLLPMKHVSYSILQATHTSPQGLTFNYNQHTLAISPVLFCPEIPIH